MHRKGREKSFIWPASSHPPGQHSSMPRGTPQHMRTLYAKIRVSNQLPRHEGPTLVFLHPDCWGDSHSWQTRRLLGTKKKVGAHNHTSGACSTDGSSSSNCSGPQHPSQLPQAPKEWDTLCVPGEGTAAVPSWVTLYFLHCSQLL